MPRYEVPKFMGYGDAIQANQTMSSAFKDLSNTSQNFLNYSENQKQNAFDNQHKTDVLNETKNQNDLTNQHWFADYTAKQNDSETKNNQWQQDYQLRKDANTWDQDYKTKTFNHTVSQDNINNGFKQQQLNKPDYATFNGVDANGNPTLNMVDKNTGKVVNTGQQVYNENKKLAPEQSLYYLDKANEMKQKSIEGLQKSLLTNPGYIGLSNEQDKMDAVNYVNNYGKIPEFKYTPGKLWGGTYSMPMSEAVKQEKQKELDKNMKASGL